MARGILRSGPSGRIHPGDWITVDYRYSLRRLDSAIQLADGTETIRQGISRLTNPEPPPIAAGERRRANLYVDYFGDGRKPDVFPILESSMQAATHTTAGLIPRTLAKLQRGEPLKIVCWGDSVTVGFDASSPQRAYPAVFAARLRAAFPRAPIQVQVVAVSGSRSAQWLHPTSVACNWDRVAAARPDLITLEFVNDSGLTGERFASGYDDILARVRQLGAELILITPHFTRPAMMHFSTLRQPESRPYVALLLEFAARHRLAVADASSRWGHLWKEGLPYPTLLHNGINHPDDRGHAIFADELMKCFAPAPQGGR